MHLRTLETWKVCAWRIWPISGALFTHAHHRLELALAFFLPSDDADEARTSDKLITAAQTWA